jgi:hypothetical protein
LEIPYPRTAKAATVVASNTVKPEAVFVPVSVLALWTGVVLFLTGWSRIRAVRAGRVGRAAFSLGEAAEVPSNVTVFNRNLMNLLEMPVLFYVACISFYVTRLVSPRVIGLAWIYVVLRLAHSLVHLTHNRVVPRMIVFALSNGVLLTLWISFLSRVL